MRHGKRGNSGARAVPLLCVCLALLVTACIPEQRGAAKEVDDAGDSVTSDQTAPVFPATGVIPADLLVQGLVYDFTTRPRDQDYWSPSTKEATCAATAIVDGVGAARLSTLGYRVATPGASLNDVALTDAERTVVVDEFSGCVDMVEAVAAVLYADGRMNSGAATCVATGLGDQQMLRPFVEAWVFGRAIDPFASNAAFATSLLAEAQVCLSAVAFNWPNVRLPDDAPLIDADAPAGSADSAYADDRRPTGSSTTAPAASATPTTPAN